MIGTSYSSTQKVSVFTLSLFEDTGWYQANYNYAQNYQWGKFEGCQFFKNVSCNITQHSQYWCNTVDIEYTSQPIGGSGCIMNNEGIGYCKIFAHSSDIPNDYRWFNDNRIGGSINSQYCPFETPKYSGNGNYFCWDSTVRSSDAFGVFRHDSRCHNYIKNGFRKEGGCSIHKCLDYNPRPNEWKSVEITFYITNVTVVCNRNDAYTYKSAGLDYMIECPNIDWVCRNAKPFECIWGEWSSNENKCLCKVGYTGNDCSIIDDNVDAIHIANDPDTFPQNNLYILGSNRDINGEWIYSGTYGVYNYYVFNDIYLYFDAWLHLWLISNNLGDSYTNMIRMCTSGNETFILPTNCNNWYTDIFATTLDPNMEILYSNYTSTVTPTIEPTIPPISPEPTRVPTKSSVTPTKTPSNSPTVITRDPTINPTSNTLFPTMTTDVPTSIPTTMTDNPTITLIVEPNKRPKTPFGIGNNQFIFDPTQWDWQEYTILGSICGILICIMICLLCLIRTKRKEFERKIAQQPQFHKTFDSTATITDIKIKKSNEMSDMPNKLKSKSAGSKSIQRSEPIIILRDDLKEDMMLNDDKDDISVNGSGHFDTQDFGEML